MRKMANDKQLAIYQETRNEIVQERYARIERQQKAQLILDDARQNLRRAQDKDRAAVQADEDIKEKQRVLVDSLNGMTEKPQYLMDKVTRLTAEQLQTYRARMAAHEIVQARQSEVRDAERDYAVTQVDMRQIDKDIADIDAKIREAQI
jgi:hypothetical protein